VPDDALTARHETATAPATRTDCLYCASEREQGRRLTDLIKDQRKSLHAVLEYADDCKARAGAQLDALTVAATLHALLAGLNLTPRPCEVCVARREALHRHAAFVTGLADLQRAEAG
jgi:hypothetical protein